MTIREGGDVVIAKDNVPLVRPVPVKSRRKRRIANLHKGAMRMHADFNDPLPEDFAVGLPGHNLHPTKPVFNIEQMFLYNSLWSLANRTQPVGTVLFRSNVLRDGLWQVPDDLLPIGVSKTG